jgi:hypothetical protein
MDEQQFWKIVAAGKRKSLDDLDQQLDAVRKRLQKLPPREVAAFYRLFNKKLATAYTWDLWGAAYLINGGCSDDGFYYFHAWLISRGQATYTAAIQNPDSLAKVVDPERDDHEFEELWYVALDVYREMTSEDMPEKVRSVRWPARPKGKNWDFDDNEEVIKRFPALVRRYF